MEDLFAALYKSAVLAFNGILDGFVSFLPSVIIGIVFMLAGYVIGWLAKKITMRILSMAHFDDWIAENNLSDSIGNKKLSEIAGSIVKWYIFFVFLRQGAALINLATLSEVLGFWINFALLLTAAIVVVLFGLIIARYIRNAIESTKQSFRKVIGLVVEVTIVYVSVVMGIRLIGLPTGVLESAFLIAFAGLILAVALIMGLSFGLALKDEARIIIKEVKRRK